MSEQHTKASGIGDFLEAAAQYREWGFSLVPTKGKEAFTDSWEQEGTPPEEDDAHWGNGHAHNMAIVLGEASGNLVNIDRDKPTDKLPNKIHNMFLPDSLMSGRKTRPYSHSWYLAPDVKSRDLYDAEGRKFLEVRSDGKLTVVWPSVHPEGDRYSWHGKLKDIAKVDAEELNRAINEWATALLLALHMPPVGSRHDYALAASGYMLRDNRLDPETVERILLGAWEAAGAFTKRRTFRELQDAVRDTYENLEANEEVKGGPTLDELIQCLPKRIGRIWGFPFTKVLSPPQNKGATPTHDELRDRWLAKNPYVAFGMGEWRRYTGEGYWETTNEISVMQSIAEVVEGAKEEGVKPTAAIVKSVTDLARMKTFVPEGLWDADPDILVCANGTLNIPSGELRDHSPHDYVTSALPYAYKEGAKAETWEHVICTILKREGLEGVADFFQEFAGLSLTPDTSHEVALWLCGPPGGGRSTLLAGLTTMLGERSGVLGLRDIQHNRFALSALPGKTLMVATEQPASYVAATDILNALISGDPVSVEKKYKDSYRIIPRAKIAWAMNDLPRVSGANDGIFRRVKVIELPTIDKKDETVKGKVMQEGSGILNWALAGLKRLRKRGHLVIPESIKTTTEEFKKANDVAALFLESACIKEAGYREPGKAVYEEYRSWCLDNGYTPKNAANISRDFDRLGFKRRRIGGKSYYEGYRILPPGQRT